MKFGVDERLQKMADSLRATICNWVGAHRGNVVLAPGILIALRIFLQVKNVRSLLMTADEYYSPQHFPTIATSICPPDDVERAVRRSRPDALLMSVVSWRGKPLDVEGTFRRLRNRSKNGLPILIADYAHAGAIGFPPIPRLQADIVVGDLNKWVMPPALAESIAFVYYTAALQASILEAFQPFYLATPKSLSVAARWLPSDQLLEAYSWIRRNRIKRSGLLLQYAENRRLADDLASAGSSTPKSCIVWPKTETPLVKRLAGSGLVWYRKDGIRVMARDLTPQKKASSHKANSQRKKVVKGT